MKTFRVFLMSLAFLGAGAGVFATAFNADDAFAQSFRVQVNSPCDTIVENEDCSVGENMCRVTSGANANKQISLFDDQTLECTPLFKP